MTDSAKIRELRARIRELEGRLVVYEPLVGPEFKNFRLEKNDAGETILRYDERKGAGCDWCVLRITEEGEISRYPGISGSNVFKIDNNGLVTVND